MIEKVLQEGRKDIPSKVLSIALKWGLGEHAKNLVWEEVTTHQTDLLQAVIEDIEEKKRKIVVPEESEHSVFKAYLRGLRQGEQNALQDLAEHYKSIKDRV